MIEWSGELVKKVSVRSWQLSWDLTQGTSYDTLEKAVYQANPAGTKVEMRLVYLKDWKVASVAGPREEEGSVMEDETESQIWALQAMEGVWVSF